MLGAGAAAATLLGVAWAVMKLIWAGGRAAFGRRRGQTRLLNQVACGSSLDFVESHCGMAQFISVEDGREQRTYRLQGGWLMIEVADNAVYAFSITITSRWMFFNTKRITFGQLNINLGRQKFGEHGTGYGGERLWIGARRVGYLRHYYFGNPGGYQNYFLSFNGSGVGTFALAEASPGVVETGSFCADVNSPARFDHTSGIDASGITINTLTVLAPHASHDEFARRGVLGPDEDRTRLATTIKPPSRLTLRHRIRNKWTRLRYSTKNALSRNARP
jgi:hypothetical protein